jgi:hypothetical protein
VVLDYAPNIDVLWDQARETRVTKSTGTAISIAHS